MIKFYLIFFVFNDKTTTEIYTYLHTRSLHDALPCCQRGVDHHRQAEPVGREPVEGVLDGLRVADQQHPLPKIVQHQRRQDEVDPGCADRAAAEIDRKSTRLNSSH